MKTWHYIWKLIGYRPWLYALNGLIWVLIHLAPLFPGLIIRDFFNQIQHNSISLFSLLVLIALILGVACARIALIVSGVFTDVLHRFLMSSLIRRNLFEQVMHRSKGRLNIGDLIVQFRDDAEQAENSISWTLDVTGKFLFAVISFSILLSIHATITCLVFIPLILIIITTNVASRKLEKYRRANRQAASAVASTIHDIAHMSQVFKLSGSETRIVHLLEQRNEMRRKLDIKDKVLTQLLDSVYANTISIGTGLILILSAGAMKNGTFTVGDFALFMYYLAFVTDFTQFFGSFLAHYRQTSVSFARMSGLYSEGASAALVAHAPLELKEERLVAPSYLADAAYEPLERLEIQRLTCIHPDTGRGIENVSFSVRRGSFTVITGKIGAGKTTLLRALLGHLPVQNGQIRWNGLEVEEPSSFFVPPVCAYTPQTPVLFTGTLADNMLADAADQPAVLERAAHLAVLDQDSGQWPEQWETKLGPGGARLSGGQAQRAAIARMFAREAELYVMDDVSSALDVETAETLWTRITALQGKTCLVASHSKSCLQHADHIVVLKEGKVEAEGSLSELLEHCEEMRKLWTQDPESGGHSTAD